MELIPETFDNAEHITNDSFVKPSDNHWIRFFQRGGKVMRCSFVFVLWIVPLLSFAQPSALDLTFNPGTGIGSGQVYAMCVETNGQIILGGNFETYDQGSYNFVTRINADGGIDTNFYIGEGPSSYVTAVAAQSNGMILIGGYFSQVNGVSQRGLARLRQDGSLDIHFTPSVQGPSVAILPMLNGTVLLAGSFTEINGQSYPALARLTSTGSLDPSFSSDITSGTITGITLDPSGNILVAGQFSLGTNSFTLARFDSSGTLDPSFQVGPLNGLVSKVALEPNGEIIITGSFSEINGYSRNGIAKLQGDGEVDVGFRPNASLSYGDILAIESDGRIFTSSGLGLMRVNTDGTQDATFNPVITYNNTVEFPNCLTIQSNGTLLIGGYFNEVNRTNISGVARLQGDSLAPFQTQLLNIQLYAGMQLAGSLGTNYRIESSSTLTNQALWTPVTNFTLTTTPYWFLDPTPADPNFNRFYRAVVVP